jgi:hypothetical protein
MSSALIALGEYLSCAETDAAMDAHPAKNKARTRNLHRNCLLHRGLLLFTLRLLY